MDLTNLFVVVMRLANAILWTVVVVRVIRNDIPSTRLVRRLFCLVLFVGMWVIVINGILTVLITNGPQLYIYTAYTVMAAIVALAIAMEEDDGT